MRLAWRRGIVTNLTSDAGSVQLVRREDGRIVSARDDLGRSVSYAYDNDGRLVTATDLAGGTWRYAYDADGALASIVDPRGKKILAATHADGKVSNVRALHAETAFHYGTSSTRAVDVLGRTTTFHRDASGITTGVGDPSGRLTVLAFDADHLPVSVTRGGVVEARMTYDDQGRLATLWRPGGQTAYAYNRRGLTIVSGAATTRYRYSNKRVVSAIDADGNRGYSYTEDGALATTTVDGVETVLTSRSDGVVQEASRDGTRLLSIAYRSDGRVASMTRGAGKGENTVVYTYDGRGFRTSADYGGGVSSSLGYDAAGNLVHYSASAPDGWSLSQEYSIGDYNEVTRIGTGEGADVSFSYDSAGRLIGAQAGVRSLAVTYDDLNRATRVDLDAQVLVEYDYARLDADAGLAGDMLTVDVLVPHGTSGIFGTMESVVYARPEPMDLGPVRYAPELRTFVAGHRHLVPDALLVSSLDRRMIPWRGGIVDERPFGSDKPSGSLFVPPEFRSVNCYVCSGSVQSVAVLAPSEAEVSEPVDVGFTVNGVCVGGPGTPPLGPEDPYIWRNDISYGDGGYEHLNTMGVATREYTFEAVGTYDISDSVSCYCATPLVVSIGSTSVNVVCPDSSVASDVPAWELSLLQPPLLQRLRRPISGGPGIEATVLVY